MTRVGGRLSGGSGQGQLPIREEVKAYVRSDSIPMKPRCFGKGLAVRSQSIAYL
jgi:hypothetical protein